MEFKCNMCKRKFYYSDEVIGLNCNGEEVSLDEYDLENNAQNPDYMCEIYCNDCYDDINYSNWCNK